MPNSHTPVPQKAKSALTAKVVSNSHGYKKPAPPTGYSQQQLAARAASGADDKPDDALGWIYSVEDAMGICADDNSPFAVYFCSQNVAKVAGEGTTARAEFAAKNGGETAPPPTIFEQREVLDTLGAAGLNKFVKVSSAEQNKDIFARFAATMNTLVVCAPDASVLASFSGTDCTEKAVSDWAKLKLYDALANWTRKATWRKADERKLKNEVITAVMDPRLSGCFQITPRIFSGSRLWDNAGYQALKKLKVSWIVSVSAAPPEEDDGREFGIGVVHVPISFNDVPRQTALMLGRCAHDLSGGIYFCADNGKDRAAAAAIIASIVIGEMDPAKAALALKQAGVPQEFKGLHAAVLAATKTTPQEFFSFPMKFEPHVQAAPLAEQMNDWQLTWDKVLLAQLQDWEVPEDWKAIDPPADAQALLDLHKPLAAGPDAKQSEYFRKLLWDGETATGNLVNALKDWRRGAKPKDLNGLNAAANRVAQSCTACHTQFRDAVDRRPAVKP